MTIKRLLKSLDLKVMTIKPDDFLSSAIKELARDDTSALVVTKDDHSVLGILSSSDIVKYLNENEDLSGHILVQDLMTHNVISCDAGEDVQQLEKLMIEHHVRHVPITDVGLLCAVVGVLDIIRYRMQSAEQEVGQLRNYVSGVA